MVTVRRFGEDDNGFDNMGLYTFMNANHRITCAKTGCVK